MIRGLHNISIPSISYTMAQGRKMSFPVDPAALIYSHFEHVSGTAAPQGTYGVAISKLNLIDVLIGQLNQIKKSSPSPALAAPTGRPDVSQQNAPQLDALIEAYGNQIRQAKAASAAMPYIPSPSAQSGAVFSLVA